MSNVEVLVACMHQQDDSLYSKMNLQTDAVLANQCDEYKYDEYVQDNGCVAKLISSADKGVGKNRNKALLAATGEYLLCADQDMIYEDGYEKSVVEAFERLKKADVVVFDLEYLNRFTPGRKPGARCKRLHWWNAMRYGAARIAIRKNALDKGCLSFSTLYGGGAKYSSGEDTLFIREALRKGLKMYYCPMVIAKVKQEESSWFQGFNEKYFVDKGVLIANTFPVLKHILVYYFAFGMRSLSEEFGFWNICSLMKKGYKEYESL